MDFKIPPRIEELRARVAAFVEEKVMPLETDRSAYDTHENIRLDLADTLREGARAQGLWCLQLKPENGGQGVGKIGMAVCYEAMNRSIFGPVIFNSAAPDDGNMMLLEAVGTEAQKERWLAPVAEGKVRSAFAMTEPMPGGGSDPSMIRTTAEKRGDHYVITGRKWFITGAEEAQHFILIARTSDDPRKGLTAFLFDRDQPGWRIERRIGIMGPEEHGGHCELSLRRAGGFRREPPNGRGRRAEGHADQARTGAAHTLHALDRAVEALRRDRARLCGRAHRLRHKAGRPRVDPDEARRSGDEDRDRAAACHEGGVGAG